MSKFVNNIGKLLISIGVIIISIGGIIYFFGDSFSWFGRLPGDIKIEKENFTFYFPLATIILVSIVINIIMRIFNYFF